MCATHNNYTSLLAGINASYIVAITSHFSNRMKDFRGASVLQVHTRSLGLSDSENNAITIVKTVLFTIVSFVWVCSIYKFINTIIKAKNMYVFAKVMSMVFTTDYTSYDFIKFVPCSPTGKYSINIL